MKDIGVFRILIAVAIIAADCSVHRNQFPPYAGSNLPAVIKYPEAQLAQAEKEKPETITTGKIESSEPKISNFWESADLKAVLQDISAQAGVIILYDETVEGTVSLELKDVPIGKALKMVLEPRGFFFKRVDEMHYLIGSGLPGSSTALALSRSESIISNKQAEEVVSLLSPDLKPFVRTSKEGYLLSVQAPPEIIERLKKDLDIIDAPEPQCVIEVIVCERKKNREQSIGIDWGQIINFSSQNALNFESGAERAYTGVVNGDLFASLNILAQRGELEIKANPRIVVMNGKPAEIGVTRDKYISLSEKNPLSAGSNYYWYPRFEARPIQSGVILKVTPQISREGEIVLTLEPEVSDMDLSGNQDDFPIINRRTVKTIVRVASGETVVIGGLHQQLERKVKKGWPILSNIPVINFFFQRERTELENSEVVIFVTPRILKAN